ncbi:MAG: efflux RND transporter periplasmic adaptor subunit [Planctomycetota bacterium]|jgi:RND family efflux transporter MFP subunit|nr:efflux RND transporter periplasmic adaptor subunit [Planctomycetota bacterium]
MRKFLVVIVLLAGVGYVTYKYVTTARERAGRRTGIIAVAVETAKVKSADLSDRTVFTGSVRAAERFDAAPKISELVKEIRVDAGDMVKRGDPLVVLDDEEYILKVEQEEAALTVAKANANDAASQLELARRDFDRARRLREEAVISVQECDQAEASYAAQQAKYEVAMAQVNQAEAALRAAKVKLSQTRIVADWTGEETRIVARRHLDPGSIARANEPILTIIDIAEVKAVINVSEKEYPKLIPGYPVKVSTDAFPGRSFAGKILRVAQELGELSREAEVEIGVANPGLALKPGMFIRAEIEFAHKDNIPAAPFEAVVRREDGDRGVFVVDRENSKVSFRPVIEGILDKGWVELVDGTELLGRDVVVLGQHLLRDGAKVTVAEES